MLKEIIQEIDNDIYKQLFVDPEEPEFAKEQIETLIAIVKNNLSCS